MLDFVKTTHLARLPRGFFSTDTATHWLAGAASLASRSGRTGLGGGLSKDDVEVVATNEDDRRKMDNMHV